MKLIDARSGDVVPVPLPPGGHTIRYPDGESITVLAIEAGLFSARAKVRSVYRDWCAVGPMASASLVSSGERWIPLAVRWMHPSFPFQHVAFLPT